MILKSPCRRFVGVVLSLGAIPFVIGGGTAPILCVGCTLYLAMCLVLFLPLYFLSAAIALLIFWLDCVCHLNCILTKLFLFTVFSQSLLHQASLVSTAFQAGQLFK